MANKETTTTTNDTVVPPTTDKPTKRARLKAAVKASGTWIKQNALTVAIVGGATSALAIFAYKQGQNSILALEDPDDVLELEPYEDMYEGDDEETVVLEILSD